MTNTTKPALSASPVGEPLRRIVLDTLNAVAPAVENLSVHQEQCDRDGVMVKVSRQALDEVLNAVNEVAMQSAITTSPASPVAQEPVAIKPLEWTSEPPYWVARVFGGFYSIERHEHGTELQGTFIRHLRCASVEAAKSAAQFDYEKRIRGALTIPPATPAGLGADEIARAVEALKPFANFCDKYQRMPETMVITNGSPHAKKQLTIGDCYRAFDALALLSRAGDQSNSTQKDGSR